MKENYIGSSLESPNKEIEKIRNKYNTLRKKENITEYEKGIVRGLYISLQILENETKEKI